MQQFISASAGGFSNLISHCRFHNDGLRELLSRPQTTWLSDGFPLNRGKTNDDPKLVGEEVSWFTRRTSVDVISA